MIESLYEPFRHWSAAGSVWLYSDPHFSDEKLRLGLGRPSDEIQVERINKYVGRKDTLIILGDVGNPEPVLQLRGRKVLICGNHDRGPSFYKKYFDEVYGGPLMISDRILLSHEPVDIDWALNIHGHDHSFTTFLDDHHFNVCSDVINYFPVSLGMLIKDGILSNIASIHRLTIDEASRRKEEKNES